MLFQCWASVEETALCEYLCLLDSWVDPISGQLVYHIMPSKHDTSTQCHFNTGPLSPSLAINHSILDSAFCGVSTEYKMTPIQCLLNVGPASPVLAIIHSVLVSTSCWQKWVHIVYTAPMPFKCWPASYTMAWHRTNVCYTDILPG